MKPEYERKPEMSGNLAPLTEDEAKLMAQFCRRIAANGHFIPEPAFEPLHGLVSMWAPELVIIRQPNKKGPVNILLAMYNGGAKMFTDMWHIPGGYNRWPEEDIQATCSRIAERELKIDVTYTRTIDVYKWLDGEHPYGHPLSLYVRCLPNSSIREIESLKFFPINELPEKMVEPHHRFIKNTFCL